jgi:hypothetical protein
VSEIHTYPVNDLIEHDTESLDCVCGPDVEYLEGGGKHVVHHLCIDGVDDMWRRDDSGLPRASFWTEAGVVRAYYGWRGLPRWLLYRVLRKLRLT